MKTGIAIMGLNGAGKTTLGKYMEIQYSIKNLDVEKYYFPDPALGYQKAQSQAEVEKRLLSDMEACRIFTLSSVKVNFSESIREKICLAVILRAGKDTRMARIQSRSFEKYGHRVLPGGDMYETESAFFEMAEKRTEEMVTKAAADLSCPVIELSGADDPEKNAGIILDAVRKIQKK